MTTSEQEQREYISSATLMVLGTDLLPTSVSSLLRMRPSKSWKRGEPKTFLGKPVGQTSHEWGGWKKSLPPSQMANSLERQVRYWARILESKADAFSTLTSLGCRCALNCYVGTSGTATIALPPELQTAIGRLGLTLEIDVFAS